MSLVVIEDDETGDSYYFDVTFKETHTYNNEITQNPVQTGASINDHVYQQPITFAWDMGMSDCLASIVDGQFSSTEQRSVSAFEVLESLWQNSSLLTITTSFKQYHNMLIKTFVVTRDKHTMFGFRATVLFQQIIVTAATDIPVTAKQSSDPQTTGQTSASTKSTAPSTSTKSITIPLYAERSATYKGKKMSIEDYFRQYSSSKGSLNKNIANLVDFYAYTITPVISSAVSSATTFTIGANTYTYEQILKKFGK